MASQKFRGVLLCEDQEHERFFRRLLEKRWFGRGKLHVNRIPNRKGAGDAYVVAEYAREVQHARRLRSENYGLVVVIDGDRKKLRRRLSQLDEQLEKAGLDRRGDHERIIICVPTRNVETWELWLCGDRDLNEDTDYKRRFEQAMRSGEVSPKKAVEAWFRPLSDEEERVEKGSLPSLAAGRLEIRRLDG